MSFDHTTVKLCIIYYRYIAVNKYSAIHMNHVRTGMYCIGITETPTCQTCR
jgi:hypothetical protein